MILTVDDLDVLTRLLSEALDAVHGAPDQAERRLQDAALLLAPPEPGVLPGWIRRRLCDYIEANLDQPLRASDLAQAAGLSVSWLGRAFRATFGCSPQAYVQQRRIARAKARMSQTRLGLAEIALECGFGDQAHLCRVFRQETGASPGQWRSGVRSALEARGDRQLEAPAARVA